MKFMILTAQKKSEKFNNSANVLSLHSYTNNLCKFNWQNFCNRFSQMELHQKHWLCFLLYVSGAKFND